MKKIVSIKDVMEKLGLEVAHEDLEEFVEAGLDMSEILGIKVYVATEVSGEWGFKFDAKLGRVYAIELVEADDRWIQA
jgi:hypothetical protein